MSQDSDTAIKTICKHYGNDAGRMMDIVLAVQEKFGCVSSAAMDAIARAVGTQRVEVESVVSFYAFLSTEQKGKVVIRLCHDVIDCMRGCDRVAEAFREELGIDFGDTTPDGLITLEYAPCIGMCDQAPAALVNETVVTHLSSDAAREIVRKLRQRPVPHQLVEQLGDGNNAHPLVQSMVVNNIRKAGPVVLAELTPGVALAKALAMSPAEVIRDIKTARLRGRGGAGFPTGLKWEFTRKAAGEQRTVLCNADEGEPGTFKDRVILTENPEAVFEGMTICGYAVGASTGILYLRGEYAYLRPFLEDRLALRRDHGLLGKDVCGTEGFSFDIRIQMGAGAYICGEETALISSCEGLRGDPKNRPPFPAQRGYLGTPTVVNNVETLCCVARILENGPGWFAEFGTKGTPGTKLLSISGDCRSPGVYELPFGVTLKEVLELAGATDARAVQVGGPSGQMLGREQFERTICFDDLATGGSIMVFGPERNVLEVAKGFMDFFIHESCGYCTPCRVGNVLLRERLEQILAGRGEPGDLDYLRELGETIRATSRCGLGQTSPNPILSTLENFRPAYEALVREEKKGYQPSFDLAEALQESEAITGRKSVHSDGEA